MNALQRVDSVISSPSTPNSSLSSQSNLISITSPNTPSPATPTQQPPQNTLPVGVTSQSPATSGSSASGHKNSLKGTKLARRARSFKDDLFEKISLMRTPTNTLGRSHSPHSPRTKNALAKPPPTAEEVAKSSQSLETHVKDISNALKHFRDVILKKKLEVLPGNGTVILETIASMYAVIQSYMLNENSPMLISATQQVYQSLAKLIKLCDEVMLSDENNECASLSSDNVREVVDLLEDAVKNLVTLSQQKLKDKEVSSFKYGPNTPELSSITSTASHNHLMRPPVEIAGQRTSLPDITLTPKERDILEKTNSNPIRASHSTESILRDTSPPPKPPLPNRSTNPPPLPPKRRSQLQQNQQHSNNISMNSDLDCSSEFSLMNYGVDHLSVRSRSPDENSSQCSLDSALNHSREEEELKALGLENRLDENMLEDDVEKIFACKPQKNTKDANGDTLAAKKNSSNGTVGKSEIGGADADSGSFGGGVCVTGAPITAGTENVAVTAIGGGRDVDGNNVDKPEMRKFKNNRHSNESGFMSMKSFRTSTQSVSKRSSDYSFQSSSKSSNSEIASNEFLQQQQQQHTKTNISSSSTTTSGTSSTAAMEQYISSTKMSSSSSISSSTISGMVGASSVVLNEDNHSIISNNTSSISPDPSERDKLLSSQVQSISSLTKTNSLDVSSSDDIISTHTDIVPPALPPKATRSSKDHRHLSQLENFDEIDDVNCAHNLAELRPHNFHQQQHHHQYQHHVSQWQTKHQSLIEPRGIGGIAGSCNAIGIEGNPDEPPPLPIKKKHILAYMEICSSSTTMHRHTMHTYNMNRNITHSQTMNIVPLPKDLTSPEHETPPALPPKNYKQRKPTATPPTIITTPPPSPKPTHLCPSDLDIDGGGGGVRYTRVLSGTQGSEMMMTVCEEISDLSEDDQAQLHHSHHLPNELDNAKKSPMLNRRGNHDTGGGGVDGHTPRCTPDIGSYEDEGIDVVLDKKNFVSTAKAAANSLPKDNLPNMLELIDITPYLIVKKENEDGPEVKGGYMDALIVHASRVQKISDNAFSEAFITTFRTFIQPIDVIEKLTHRYTVFFCPTNDLKQKAAKETFSLLVRVVNDLTFMDLTSQLFTILVEFVYQLVCSGQLYLAKLLRNKFVEKVTLFKEQKLQSYQADMHFTVTNQPSLLDLKSLEIAEQMTLLDAELFQKIEIPEVLLFAKEQCEEKSPNLNKFTEHFNKMSYWARSKILLADAKEREKHVIKFIKIMKHLRKMNNYNSYLALLSALDSAPIRRLEWHKTIIEGLKEYCTLIDSSSSFRVYRQALGETNPPCIPYIGLVLQDLTFVHVGNPDYLKEGVINFSKRWQQHNIIVNMKRFKKCSYPFRRNERIIHFFENFENFLGEEEMWQISENIKPRGKRPLHN